VNTKHGAALGVSTLVLVIGAIVAIAKTMERIEQVKALADRAQPIAIAAFIVLTLVMLVIYIRHVSRNENLSPTRKVVWIVALVLFNAIAMTCYWFLQVWLKSMDQT